MSQPFVQLHKIFQGEVVRVTEFGAFVSLPNTKQNGLVHRSQMSACRVDNPSEIVDKGEKVWCKVIKIADDGKIALSMKLVQQGSGKDLDPNNVQLDLDERRRQQGLPPQAPRIQLDAVLDTTCKKCGGRGHLAKDCFQIPGGKVYDLIASDDELMNPTTKAPTPKKSKKVKKKEKKKKEKKKKKRRFSDSSSSVSPERTPTTSFTGRERKRKYEDYGSHLDEEKRKHRSEKELKFQGQQNSRFSDHKESHLSKDNYEEHSMKQRHRFLDSKETRFERLSYSERESRSFKGHGKINRSIEPRHKSKRLTSEYV